MTTNDDLENPPTETTPLISKGDESPPSESSSARQIFQGIASATASAGGVAGSVVKGTIEGTGKVAKATIDTTGKVVKGTIDTTGKVVVTVGQATVDAAGYAAMGGVQVGQKLEAGYGGAITWYDKLFLKHVNPDFGDALEVSSRGACFVVICALPFILPKEICPKCEWLVESDYYTSTCIVYFIYTLYLHTGDTIHFAQGGIGGTVLAVFNCWMMQGFMPGGYHEREPMRWWIGSVWGILFVFGVLWFNFDDITRIFALSTFVWYWMAFLEPGFNWGFARNFEIRIDGVAIKELAVACLGCAIAGIAGFVPYPIFAHTKALQRSKGMIEQIYMAKKDFLSYYCGKTKNDMAVKVLSSELEAIRNQVNSIPGLLDSAWYESFGYKKWIKQRRMINKFAVYAGLTCDRLANVFQICESETFDDMHVQLMEAIQDPLHDIVEHNAAILATCIDILFKGAVLDEWIDQCEVHIKAAKAAVEDLTDKFKKQREKLDMDMIASDIAGENVAGITLCKFTEMTRDFYGDLKAISDDTAKVKKNWKQGEGFLGLFEPDILTNKDHVVWVMRNGISIVLAFYVGFHGYNRYILNYNANIAGTVSVLLSNFAGSASLKNMARLQGVVIGIVLGNLLYALFGWCTLWGHLCVAIVLYLWSLFGLFMYYHSTQYSTVGLLLVVFGTKSLLRQCSDKITDPKGYTQIVDVTVAILIMTLVDTLLSPARASDLAKKAFHEAYIPLIEALENLFDHKDPTIRRQEGALLKLIGNADFLGKEASLEPRFWRCAWPQNSFEVAVKALGSLRFSMNSMEINVLHKSDRTKKEEFLEAIRLESFTKKEGVQDLLILHCRSVMEAVEASLSDNATHDIFKTRLKKLELLDETDDGQKASAKRRLSLSRKKYEDEQAFDKVESVKSVKDGMNVCRDAALLWKDAMNEFSNELNALFSSEEEKKKAKEKEKGKEKSLSEDVYADICMIVESLRSMFEELDKVLRTISA